MKPIMRAAFAMLAFAVLPSEVWAQAETESEAERERRERMERAAEQYRARQEGGEAAVEAVRERQAESAAERAREAQERARERAREAQERAREAAARAVEDYRFIYGIVENAELAVALAKRALENAESEEDYAETWRRHREATQYAESVFAISREAERLAVSARDNAESAASFRDFGIQADGLNNSPGADNYYRLANNAAQAAVENANEVANLRAQLEG